jgi:hypothetical protein
LVNISAWFANSAFLQAKTDRLAGLNAATQQHPYDSHPPLLERLAALGQALDDFTNHQVTAMPERPLSASIADCEAREEHLSKLVYLTLTMPLKKALREASNL